MASSSPFRCSAAQWRWRSPVLGNIRLIRHWPAGKPRPAVTLDNTITGLHHITVIAGDAQENLDFYAGVLGMRLVKKTVNQDVPGTYHLFYADGAAHAGTDLTFFPWPDMAPGRRGVGLTVEVALAVPMASLSYWGDRLAQHGIEPETVSTRFGETLLSLVDPHGLRLALVETADPREFMPWDR